MIESNHIGTPRTVEDLETYYASRMLVTLGIGSLPAHIHQMNVGLLAKLLTEFRLAVISEHRESRKG